MQRLESITEHSLGLYTRFLGFTSFVFPEGDELSLQIKNRMPEKYLVPSNDAVVITAKCGKDRKRLFRTPAQLLYDLEVFNEIPLEVAENVTQEKFRAFAQESLSKIAANGWNIFFTMDNFDAGLTGASNLSFLNSESSPQEKNLIVINSGEEEYKKFYDKHRADCRIEKKYFLEFIIEYVVTLLYEYIKSVLEPQGVYVCLTNWSWAHNHILFPSVHPTSAEREVRNHFAIYEVAGNENNYQAFLTGMYGAQSPDFYKELFDIPPKIQLEPGYIRHKDAEGKLVNVQDGERRTLYCTDSAQNAVWLFGGCVFFGYAELDEYTVASFLQKKLNENGYKYNTHNYGTWGGVFNRTYRMLGDMEFRKGDAVVITYSGRNPVGEFDISENLGKISMEGDFYYDAVYHCNRVGYEKVADSIFDILRPHLAKDSVSTNQTCTIPFAPLESSIPELGDFIIGTKGKIPFDVKNKTVGSIVMNCNPFTNGHLHLAEYAASQCDFLIIFVVQTDKSVFPFKERFKLAQENTAHLKNVAVVPSGNFIISTVTFPAYFTKDNPKQTDYDCSQDVAIFARHIAPAFNITKRFVGEEPFDLTTRGYNKKMQEVLPRHGIEVVEIKRKEVAAQGAISASTVRKKLQQGDFAALEELVPPATFRYLKENWS